MESSGLRAGGDGVAADILAIRRRMDGVRDSVTQETVLFLELQGISRSVLQARARIILTTLPAQSHLRPGLSLVSGGES